MSEKKQIKVSEVLALLEAGQDRATIRETLGLTHQEMASLFQHPKLKHKKPKTSPSFTLIDDTEEAVEETTPSSSSEGTSEVVAGENEGGAVADGNVPLEGTQEGNNDGVASTTEEETTAPSGVWQD